AKEIPVNTPVSDIEVQESQYGLKFKLIAKNGFAGGGGRPKAGNESFALAYAKDIVVAMIPKMENPKSADLGKVAVTLAETFYTFLESKKK
ncbi:MAG TPA: hypothetical protein VD794_05845, partial [Flavisolibacter sp.]|nr:hypothetical protein [Flavisolibacter sp.]